LIEHPSAFGGGALSVLIVQSLLIKLGRPAGETLLSSLIVPAAWTLLAGVGVLVLLGIGTACAALLGCCLSRGLQPQWSWTRASCSLSALGAAGWFTTLACGTAGLTLILSAALFLSRGVWGGHTAQGAAYLALGGVPSALLLTLFLASGALAVGRIASAEVPQTPWDGLRAMGEAMWELIVAWPVTIRLLSALVLVCSPLIVLALIAIWATWVSHVWLAAAIFLSLHAVFLGLAVTWICLGLTLHPQFSKSRRSECCTR
jgi:hypothetical protein